MFISEQDNITNKNDIKRKYNIYFFKHLKTQLLKKAFNLLCYKIDTLMYK